MPSALETRVNRKNTEAFIAFDPFQVILQHADMISTPAGGRIRGPVMSRVPQTARLYPLGSTTAPVRTMLDGEEVTAPYILLMLWDAVVERGDWFYVNGLKYEVVWLPEAVERTYETKCEVTLRG